VHLPAIVEGFEDLNARSENCSIVRLNLDAGRFTVMGDRTHLTNALCNLYDNAIKYLEDFSTSDPELSLRTSGSLGDAYAEKGNFEKAISSYKKASTTFEQDELNTAEYLYRLAQSYDKAGKTEDAIEAFMKLKSEFPSSLRSGDVDKYLAKLGETK